MPTSCCAFGCSNNNQKLECREKKISFHLFPRDLKLADEWLIKIKRKNFKITKTTRICSAHFEEHCFTYENFTNRRLLKQSAIPTKFIFNEAQKPPRKRTSYTFAEGVSSSFQAHDCEELDDVDDLLGPSDAATGISTQTEVIFSDLLDELHLKNDEIAKLKIAFSTRFSPQDMTSNETLSLTGLTKQNFITVFDFLLLEQSLQSTECKLPPIKQYLLFMIKLRSGISCNFLAYILDVSPVTVSRVFNRVAAIMYNKIKKINIWPSRDQVTEFVPLQFRLKYSNCRIIVDCTEIKIQKPFNPRQQQLTFSYYKNANTVKALIGIAPSGGINYISDVWCGSTSDKFMFLNSSLPDLLERGDLVLADKGFLVRKELEAKGCQLATSIYLKDKIQFTLHERAHNKSVSHLRVHIERAISRIKKFKYFGSTIPFNSLHNINEIFYIAAFLSNFCHSLMSFNSQDS